MRRIVLLGLGNNDVDILTRISRMNPRPEVLAVHPDPEALVLRLASVACYPALTEPPRPRADDVVVMPVQGGAPSDVLVGPWRELGATVVRSQAPDLEDLVRAAVPAPPPPSPALAGSSPQVAVQTAPAVTAESPPSNPDSERSPTRLNTEDSTHRNGGEDEAVSPPPIPVMPPPAAAPPIAATPPATAPAANPDAPPAEIWERPEATFQYLVGQASDENAPACLWWDGAVGTWVPWVWTGTAPGPGSEIPRDALGIPCEWGVFRLAASPVVRARVNRNAVARVAEDLALRDLMGWRRRSRSVAECGVPNPAADAADLAGWLEPVLEVLDVSTALIWKREEDGMRLVHAHGDGLGLDGVFAMPRLLVARTFEHEGSPWRAWEPVSGLRIHLGAPANDPRWRLRLRRVEMAMEGKEPAW